MAAATPGADPVLLVHGYMDTAASPWWRAAERRLRRVGYDRDRIHRVGLGSVPGTTVGSPRAYGRRVRAAIGRVAADAEGQVDVLAHSMGGLCARWGIERLDGAAEVDDLVTLGTPHQGSRLAYLGLATAGGRAMVPGSPFLRDINGDPVPDGVDYTAVWSAADEAIRPATNAALPVSVLSSMAGQQNVRVEGAGHMDLVSDPAAIERYVEYLD
jgi:triacylglycerol esterase/lipase EstA (alpha/beta hydrolase family)